MTFSHTSASAGMFAASSPSSERPPMRRFSLWQPLQYLSRTGRGDEVAVARTGAVPWRPAAPTGAPAAVRAIDPTAAANAKRTGRRGSTISRTPARDVPLAEALGNPRGTVNVRPDAVKIPCYIFLVERT